MCRQASCTAHPPTLWALLASAPVCVRVVERIGKELGSNRAGKRACPVSRPSERAGGSSPARKSVLPAHLQTRLGSFDVANVVLLLTTNWPFLPMVIPIAFIAPWHCPPLNVTAAAHKTTPRRRPPAAAAADASTHAHTSSTRERHRSQGRRRKGVLARRDSAAVQSPARRAGRASCSRPSRCRPPAAGSSAARRNRSQIQTLPVPQGARARRTRPAITALLSRAHWRWRRTRSGTRTAALSNHLPADLLLLP